MNLDLLRQKRIEMGFKQSSIADKLDITTKTYNFKENGKAELKISELALLCNILKISKDDFIRIFFNDVFPNVKNS